MCRLRRCIRRDRRPHPRRRVIIATRGAEFLSAALFLTLSLLASRSCRSLSSPAPLVPHPRGPAGGGGGGGGGGVRSYFATCIPGLEDALASELTRLGADNVRPARSGVKFTEPATLSDRDDDSGDAEGGDDEGRSATDGDGGGMEVGMRAILWLRTAHRVMELISTTEDAETGVIADRDDLYDFVRDTVDVRDLLGDGRGGMLSLAVKATSGGRLPRELCHSHYSALTVKNALVDACRELRDDGRRPDVDTDDPSVPLVLALHGVDDGRGASASLYRCLSGHSSLHRRGYRADAAIHKAALKESLAAGLLLESGWNLLVEAAKRDGLPATLVDPMAGSGTFCIEAALMAADVAPGLLRQRLSQRGGSDGPYVPPAIRWKCADARMWSELLQEAAEREEAGRRWLSGSDGETGRPNCVIVGNDVNAGAVGLARRCSKQARVDGVVRFHEGSCGDWRLDEGDVVGGRTIVVVNPPWGVRLAEDVEDSWEALKEFLRRECGGAEAWVLSGNKDLTRLLRMKKSRSMALNTADEKLRWLQYHIFKSKHGNELTPDEGRIVEESMQQSQ